MFVETSLEVSPALSPKPLTPAAETLPLPFVQNSLFLKQKLERCWEAAVGMAAVPMDARCGSGDAAAAASLVLVGLSLPEEQNFSILPVSVGRC